MSALKIRPADNFWGIKYWRQILPPEVAPPRLLIFEYVGSDPDKDLHFFRQRKTAVIIWRHVDKLSVDGFGPFLMDKKKIKDAFEANGRISPI